MLVGTTLKNRYYISQELGSGGFGDTYLAEDRDLPDSDRCVVKHLKPKNDHPKLIATAKRLFEREAKALYNLGSKSDRIPSLFAYFEEGGEFYLVQEYIDGEDLSKELTSGKQWGESEVRELLVGILEVLEVAHREKVIHRDIKPENLMRRQEDGKIILIDFGAVKEIDTLGFNPQGQVVSSMAIGTLGYMPSEQISCRPKLSSDIYAVGMLGIQALTGTMPAALQHDPDTGQIAWRDRASVSQKLAKVLDKMVRTNFAERYQDAMEARSALVAAQGKLFRNRRKILLWGLFGGMGFVGAVLSKNLWDRSSPPEISDEPEVMLSLEALESPQPEETPGQKMTTQTFETVKVNTQGEIIEQERRQGQVEVLTENLGNGVILEMVSIPGGRFLMGSPETEAERDIDEGPQYQVNVPAFFLGKYPVTQAQYEAVMGKNPSSFKGANRPVEKVSWNDATEFCQKLSQQTGKTYRLPSETEWEYACRAGTTTPFYFGETLTTDLANYNGDYTYGSGPKGVYRLETTDVRNFPANAFGLYDMHGNVWEWCQDVWHENYNGAPSDGSAWESGAESSKRLVRGGSWNLDPWYSRSAGRLGNAPGYWRRNLGFRVALAVPS